MMKVLWVWVKQLCCDHQWSAYYISGRVSCPCCKKVSKKNYYYIKGSEKY